jgi:hypothetical protein
MIQLSHLSFMDFIRSIFVPSLSASKIELSAKHGGVGRTPVAARASRDPFCWVNIWRFPAFSGTGSRRGRWRGR